MNKSTLDQNDQSGAKEDQSPLAKFYDRLKPREQVVADGLEKARDAALDRDDEDRVEQIEAEMMRFVERTGLLNFILGPTPRIA